ncbi:MAG: acyl-CoA/acyl-ACP dehydrogenase [Actinobacteria bacterium]|nr:acyl-CoA/acyl-ACP dehydrogenase [Actinomycetota bacterium]
MQTVNVDALERATELATRFEARAHQHDDDAAFPSADIDDLREAGLLGLLVPERLGGLGARFADYVDVAVVLAGGSPATALVFNMHASVTGALAGIPDEHARALGVPEWALRARDAMLQEAADGAVYGVAISEPQVGSRLSALTTAYEREGDGYRLRGTKSACSGAGHLDAYLVAARAARDPDQGVISYFLVPEGDGIVAGSGWDPLGMRATASNALRLDVHVPSDRLVGGLEGLVLPLAWSMPQWLVASYAAVYVGVAEAAVQSGADYLRRRLDAGRNVTSSVRRRLGRADADVQAARLVLQHAARLVDDNPGEPETNRWLYRTKLLAGDVAMSAVASVAEACGLGALSRGAPLERLFRDARFGAIMPPASDACADYLGATTLGLDPVVAMEETPW